MSAPCPDCCTWHRTGAPPFLSCGPLVWTNPTLSADPSVEIERLRGAMKNDATMYRDTIEAQAIEIERLRKESAAHWSLARTNGEDAAQSTAALAALRDAAVALCGSEGIADDTTEVNAGSLSELRRAIETSRTAAAKDRIAAAWLAGDIKPGTRVVTADRLTGSAAYLPCHGPRLRNQRGTVVRRRESPVSRYDVKHDISGDVVPYDATELIPYDPRRPACPECKGDLGGVEIGRIEEHRRGCSRLPL